MSVNHLRRLCLPNANGPLGHYENGLARSLGSLDGYSCGNGGSSAHRCGGIQSPLLPGVVWGDSVRDRSVHVLIWHKPGNARLAVEGISSSPNGARHRWPQADHLPRPHGQALDPLAASFVDGVGAALPPLPRWVRTGERLRLVWVGGWRRHRYLKVMHGDTDPRVRQATTGDAMHPRSRHAALLVLMVGLPFSLGACANSDALPVPIIRAAATAAPTTTDAAGGYSRDVPISTPPAAPACDPAYRGDCLPSDAFDVDCPSVDGPVVVVGSDHYGLDADHDGTGCETS